MIRTSRYGSHLLILACLLSLISETARAQFATATIDAAGAPDESRPAEFRPPRKIMASLYAGFGASQALDVCSTLRAIHAGAQETNPMLRWATSSPASFVAIKAATTTGTILIVDRVSHKHPKAALFLLVAIDSAYSVVIAHNYMTADRVSR